MAYMRKNGNGPYPNKAGEFCGNHHVGSSPLLTFHQTPEEAARQQREWLARMRFGRPRATEAYTSEGLTTKGMVGLYLREDSGIPLFDDEHEIPTPPELMEPVAADAKASA